jgi:N-acetylneuraminic acid mutarotase
METARSEHPAVVLDDEIVVLGGLVEAGVGRTGVTSSVEAYDPDTDTWRQLPELPEARHHGMAAVVVGRLFFIGGYTQGGNPSLAVWELVDGAWRNSQPLPLPAAAAAAVATDDAIYLVGGVPDGLFHRYDVAAGRWSALTPPMTQREHVAAAIVEEEVWAIAGRWMGEIFDTTEIYDPEAESWREGPTLTEPRSGFGAAVVGKVVIVAGGEVFDPDQALTSVERLNAEPEGWFPIESLPHGLHGNPLLAIGGDVYLPGGSTRPAGVANDGEIYRLTVG